jgi:hypothetical protein
MARLLRLESEDAVYHLCLCARGNARLPIFHDERNCVRFVTLISDSTQRFNAATLCFAGKKGVKSQHLTVAFAKMVNRECLSD